MWMNGFNYLPRNNGSTNHDITYGGSGNVINITQVFQETYDDGVSGFLLALAGIGGLKLNATTGEPSVISDMRAYILSAGNIMMVIFPNVGHEALLILHYSGSSIR
jgi:hypothetical protein